METVLEMDLKDTRLEGTVIMHAAWGKDQWHTLQWKKKFESLKMSSWSTASFSLGIQLRKVRLTF